ncbi:hypothetical protein [Laceyella tengchongensis]|uniref:hypothetical protein n=1 Tax=Laceyella tengchongensis TaxID=574699 RepID=UPI0025471616|nr:hypothetical protein [Laceyella tengchongensis]
MIVKLDLGYFLQSQSGHWQSGVPHLLHLEVRGSTKVFIWFTSTHSYPGCYISFYYISLLL